jgi:type I restriction enzyme M protein
MITGELKSKVDRIWDTMWSGGVSNPLSVIEQLTYLLFIKRLDELHTLRESKAARTGKPIEEPVFTAKQESLRWSRFKETAPEKMFETVRDQVFPFIKTLGQNGGDAAEGDSTYSHHMKDALFMMPTARVLANVVDQLDGIDMADSDTKGDLYEYMLGKIASAGQNGQFRTPRHIIRLMVEMTAPTPKDVICDPACGTAGFLIAASEILREQHGDAVYKTAASRRKFNEGTFHGYDFDPTMLRIGSMNMLLHSVENPDIRYKDSLAQADEDDAERYSLILANPPFAGSLDYESTAKDLQQIVKTKKTELLFLALFLRLLQTGGRAAVIVPDGVLFGSSNAHKALRKILVAGAVDVALGDPRFTTGLGFREHGGEPLVSIDGRADDASVITKLDARLQQHFLEHELHRLGIVNNRAADPVAGLTTVELGAQLRHDAGLAFGIDDQRQRAARPHAAHAAVDFEQAGPGSTTSRRQRRSNPRRAAAAHDDVARFRDGDIARGLLKDPAVIGNKTRRAHMLGVRIGDVSRRGQKQPRWSADRVNLSAFAGLGGHERASGKGARCGGEGFRELPTVQFFLSHA